MLRKENCKEKRDTLRESYLIRVKQSVLYLVPSCEIHPKLYILYNAENT